MTQTPRVRKARRRNIDFYRFIVECIDLCVSRGDFTKDLYNRFCRFVLRVSSCGLHRVSPATQSTP